MFQKKYGAHTFLALLALLVFFYSGFSQNPEQKRIDASTIAAIHFLELIDAGQYEQSWQISATYLKNDILLNEWVKRLSEIHAVVGKVVERKQKSSLYTNMESQKGVPAGKYMIYVFDSKVQASNAVTETITLMLEKDNSWRIAGYFID